ncbi:zinc-dependent alcohol dehydrogenase family protein [Hydrogenibacillus sp. N12]|nr:zinc-dependent alcohol dehydrogenase family protein [Hydrogenibacillus sp. N12]
MKAAVLRGIGRIELEEREVPSPAYGEVVIRVEACGICGTDQHIYHGLPGSAAVTPPRVLGHELAGEVVEIGEGVSELSIGDRVSVDPNIYCGRCRYCRDGRPHLCESLQAVGVTRDGGMAEYCRVPVANCHRLPDSMSSIEGAMVEPLGCVLHGIRKINVWPGASVLIIGGGFIGQLMLQAVKLHGASPVIISEPDEAKHELALRLGADVVVNPLRGDDLERELKRIGGADIVVECVGKAETMQQAVQSARKGGQILLFGVSSPDTRIAISPYEVFSKELTIRGSFINPHTHTAAISLIEQGKVRISPLISHTFRLEEVPEVMRKYPELHVMKGIIRIAATSKTTS